MSEFVFTLPDLGEGTVEAEIVEWHVKPGDVVKEDQIIADVMTDKANVEVPSPVSGKVVSLGGNPGDQIAVGAPLITFETDQAVKFADVKPAPPKQKEQPAEVKAAVATTPAPAPPATTSKHDSPRPLTSPAIRKRARQAGIELDSIPASGPGGRITRSDLDGYLHEGRPAASTQPQRTGVDEIKVIGVRRAIARALSESKRTIPHFAYVEEVDVTELEALRAHLNSKNPSAPGLTYLPFLGIALVKVLRQFPQCNATYDEARGVIMRHHAVHLGIATQSPDGLKVPVVRHAEARNLNDLATEIRRLAGATRDGSATPKDLSGSTITITSLGRLGGIVSTPIINAPEVAIIGVNKSVERPMVIGGQIVVRRMMNLSSSFDHRFVDGFDAAALIQALKECLEHPATIFM